MIAENGLKSKSMGVLLVNIVEKKLFIIQINQMKKEENIVKNAQKF